MSRNKSKSIFLANDREGNKRGLSYQYSGSVIDIDNYYEILTAANPTPKSTTLVYRQPLVVEKI